MRCSPVVALVMGAFYAQGCSHVNPVQPCNSYETSPERVFLQKISATSAVIRWRGDADAICFGTQPDALNVYIQAEVDGTHRYAQLRGLAPDTEYHYSIGAAATAPSSQYFRTAPRPGQLPADGNLRLWIVGDSGTAAEINSDGELEHEGDALAVLDGYHRYNAQLGGNANTDLFLQLGDTAYPAGTDKEWQQAFFDVYPDLLRSSMTVPTIGNHGMGYGPFDLCLYQYQPACDQGPVVIQIGGASQSADPMSYDGDGNGPDGTGMPYLEIFDLPTQAELGGAPSGTEQYYAMDYGPLHIVSLDSQLAIQDPVSLEEMRNWLVSDLQSNQRKWTLVIFHHPPYSKGENHDSDLERSEIVMREQFVPVFDNYKVDVVYNGHAHSYERSWYLHGHYGPSTTFDHEQHSEIGSDGEPSLGQDDDPYHQVSRTSERDDKTVYTVAGNAGHTSYAGHPCREGQIYGCTTDDWLAHPAHRSFDKLDDDYGRNGIARIGSVVVDVTAKRIESRFIDDNGEVLDYFVITRE